MAKSSAKKEKLAAQDWLAAAFRALTKGGPAAIKAEAIARDLGVSKGSFYWHFADVPTLKTQMLSHWEARATQAIIVDLEELDADPQEKLLKLMAVSTSPMNTQYGGPLVEPAIRDWARYDKSAARVVKRVDAARIDYVEGLFRGCKLSPKQSRQAAQLLYSSLIGSQILSEHKLADAGTQMNRLLDLLLGS